ncbi:hypothetical protein [Rhizosphaericola mali]|uniref:Esterase-like activity of phytase family protein n=1 Tax=Rhizosphaericola mali TaxID=2545455 RepID=A0A5P2G0N5_9BACT|nr:hypothetical protein [Rhizosphaericola mali]QES88995.1 hypothetical protein E0W69_010120 [Rhizosphaericola mali]
MNLKSIGIASLLIGNLCFGQNKLDVHSIKLPANVSYYDNQYSSLYLSDGALFLMSESRLEDNRPAFVDKISTKELQKSIKDSSYTPQSARLPIIGLSNIRMQIDARNQKYEGLEAMAIHGKEFFFSIETDTPSDSCYLLKGKLENQSIILDSIHFLGLPKPKDSNGKNVYNAGYESLEVKGNQLIAVFEYNYFDKENKLVVVNKDLNPKTLQYESIAKIPFRITDISDTKGGFYAINYFFNGGGGDAVYRIENDAKDYNTVFVDGKWKSYARIVKLINENDSYSYQPIMDLPENYWAYNWEGLAMYKNGFFILNDKYTPKRPYSSTLLFMDIKKAR